ncbi:hypothetical protein B0T09DRAFT_374171 [Sordaria sp. MPI-SDFR-AT-0083]|nr:hypothetical protein B0T09DRAFT_374171 [Sordaria sp. MPI-SDFR-AT-0083]
MFPTFTGNSRKGRNVNLSGQRTSNPFTSTSWGASSAAGASKTVAHAQAERQQRQHERDRIRAAQRIQRTWRAHRVRRNLRDERRQAIDRLYEAQPVDASQRSAKALPLVFATFQAFDVQDRHRLALVTQDCFQTDFIAFSSGVVDLVRVGKLIRILLAALTRCDLENEQNEVALFLRALGAIGTKASDLKTFEQTLGQWYNVLGRLCQETGLPSSTQEIICSLVVAPLDVPHGLDSIKHTAYQNLVVSVLTQPDLARCSNLLTRLADSIDLDRLSNYIIDLSHKLQKHDPNAILWLIAHYIAIKGAKEQQTSRLLLIKTLESLFPLCSAQIRSGFAVVQPKGSEYFSESEQDGTDALPPFVRQQLQSLVGKGAIQDLLSAFTATTGKTSTSADDDASHLAGFIITLINIFPAFSEDIRMYLYVADIATAEGGVPAAKYFWNATQKTSVFSDIAPSKNSTLEFLRRKPASPAAEMVWHREWKTVLLFLESFIFVLRLMDDDDFFSALNPHHGFGGPSSRLRLASMSLGELKLLTQFLKHLSFTMYYNAEELLTDSPWTEKRNSTRPRGDGAQASKADSFLPPAGVDFTTLRDLATTAMKMLYERDSRRPFLPEGHWLMTSKFDMEGFLAAVVLEEQRQHELRNNEDGEDSSEDDQEGWSHYAQLENLRQKNKKRARNHLMSAITPKLEILRNMPFVIPFETRVQIFRQFIQLDKQRRRGGNGDPDMWRAHMINRSFGPQHPLGRHSAKIRRGRVFEDAMKQLWALGEGLKEPIQVTFEDEFGMQEAGIDGGGVTKEFLDSVTTEAFTHTELFVTNSKNAYYPNPTLIDRIRHMWTGEPEETQAAVERTLKEYEFLGRVIGKCMYEGILIDIVFAGFFLLKWAAANDTPGGGSNSPASASATGGYRANINDLRELDEELYQGMLKLKNYTGDIQTDLALDFTITDPINIPGEPTRTIIRPLIPNGESIPVTNENRPLYISYVARHRLVRQPYPQTRAFLRGLGSIIDPSWLSMFNQLELQRLVGGDSSEIDVEDLRRNTYYNGVYEIGDDGEEHETIQIFWEVMHELRDEERREVLKYVTSTPRAPLLGFGQLRPRFTIRDAGRDQERLPSASTCVNLLKLPQYRSKRRLKEKLLYAVKSGAGFNLS